MASPPPAEAILDVFMAVEQRDEAAFAQACWPLVEFCWPLSLPYGGTARGRGRDRRGWATYWDWLQPTAAERRLDPRVIAARGSEAVVLWRQRGLSSAGDRLDSEVLGLYAVRDRKLGRGQMFYFDAASVCAFLAGATPQPNLRRDQPQSTP